MNDESKPFLTSLIGIIIFVAFLGLIAYMLPPFKGV